jgi:lysophospholipase L1-like esterase
MGIHLNREPGKRNGPGLLFLFFILGICPVLVGAQPFESEIRAFKTQDSAHFPARHSILFVGSSSFRLWSDVQNYFPSYPIINRGFGGSRLLDLTRYRDQIIFAYNPKQIVIYCGENDLASSDTVSAKTVFSRFVHLFELIRRRMPGENIVFISLKPSPSRLRLKDKMEKANRLIQDFLSTQKNVSFVDVYHAMLGPDGRPMPNIYGPDSLHMARAGYLVWQKAIQPYLVK